MGKNVKNYFGQMTSKAEVIMCKGQGVQFVVCTMWGIWVSKEAAFYVDFKHKNLH
jgi:hypothetical protein